jgi:hypothetical protein
MNERIKELAEQAGIKEYPAKLSVYKEDDGTTSSKWEYPLEKFAELIVRECILELGISKKCDPYTGELFVCEHNAVLDEQIDMLKEIFGVEE